MSTQPPTTTSVFKRINRNMNDNNPFLDTPARKAFKRRVESDTNSSYQSNVAMLSSTSSSDFVRRLSEGTHTFTRTTTAQSLPINNPHRLILTRVLPSNVNNGIITTTSLPISNSTTATSEEAPPPVQLAGKPYHGTVAASSNIAINRPTASRTPMVTTQDRDNHSFIVPSAPVSRRPEYKQQEQQEQHPSTTPKVPPNRQYFDQLAKSLESKSAPKLNLDLVLIEEESQTQKQHEPELDKEKSVGHIPSVDSTMMAFARKSIMQHSSVAPASIFRKLSNKPGPQPLTHSQARSLIDNTGNEDGNIVQSSITTKPKSTSANVSTSIFASVNDATTTNTVSSKDKDFADKQMAKTVMQECTRHWEPAGDLAFTFVSETKPTSTPSLASVITTRPLASEVPSSSRVFARSVLDLSNTNEPKIQRKFNLNTATSAAATNTASNSNTINQSTIKSIYPNKSHQPPSITTTLNNISSAAETKASTTVLRDVDMEMSEAEDKNISDVTPTPPTFNLREALRMDSARIKYQLPNLIASLSPPTSPRRRPTPYSVPSANDRESLRIRRMPKFKARPLNPKIFTGAGDLGLPKIQKPALTVPVSPVFSHRRRVKDAVAIGGLTKEKDVSTSVAAKRLRNMINSEVVKRKEQKQQTHEPLYPAGRQLLGARTAGTARPHPMRSQKEVLSSNKDSDADLGGISSGARRIEVVATRGQSVFGSTLNPIARTSTIIPSLEQTRPDVDAEDREPDVYSIRPAMSAAPAQTSNSSAISKIGEGIGVGMSKLRRPEARGITRPVPFKFATTELQKKRMIFQPTPSDYSLITSSSFGTTGKDNQNQSQNSSRGLSLEDLMPEA
ncbi:hypothetical protein FBU30_006356 [Linnemannia zychae]|nr:hypothetical protein FBU30_006356 [Linnemannia zychae]